MPSGGSPGERRRISTTTAARSSMGCCLRLGRAPLSASVRGSQSLAPLLHESPNRYAVMAGAARRPRAFDSPDVPWACVVLLLAASAPLHLDGCRKPPHGGSTVP